MRCHKCEGSAFTKAGRDRSARQLYHYHACKHRQTLRSASAFRSYRFPDDVIALAVRWYLHFRLPYAVCPNSWPSAGVHVDPSTVFDWVQQFTPLYKEAARPRRRRVGRRWSIDETYIRITGRWSPRRSVPAKQVTRSLAWSVERDSGVKTCRTYGHVLSTTLA